MTMLYSWSVLAVVLFWFLPWETPRLESILWLTFVVCTHLCWLVLRHMGRRIASNLRP